MEKKTRKPTLSIKYTFSHMHWVAQKFVIAQPLNGYRKKKPVYLGMRKLVRSLDLVNSALALL